MRPGPIPITLLAAALLAAAPAARADEAPAAAHAAGIPDVVLAALQGRRAVVRLADGRELAGLVVRAVGDTVTMVLAPSGETTAFARASIVGARLLDAPPPAVVAGVDSPWAVARQRDGAGPESYAPPAPDARRPAQRTRHFSLGVGISPSVMMDVEYGHFYAFANASTVLPMATKGDILAFSVGAGGCFAVSRRWRLELLAYYAPLRVDGEEWGHGFGIGFGAHYTFDNGVTLGLRLPVVGYALEQRSSGSIRDINGDEAIAVYYLTSFAGLPVFSFGYRF